MAQVHLHSFVQDPATAIAPLADALTARQTLTPQQQRIGMLLGTGLAWALLLHPSAAFGVLHTVLTAAFIALIVWRAVLVWAGRKGPVSTLSPQAGGIVGQWGLPRYTVLVALYHESRALPGLIGALAALDYPVSQLEILFLTETDDKETHDALAALTLPAHMRVIVVPPGAPRTKPRALNHGLLLATGHFLVIYDAEDRPDPQQLREAARTFMYLPQDHACLQAPLRAYNQDETWMSGQWALEYLVHFHRLVPGLSRLGLPVPLGGTSNHFRTRHLREVGGWDPWNVTEDADLGIRLARHGLRTGVIAPATLEEAPTRLKVWTAQRSRWFKGHSQTWLVTMRRPRRLWRELGPAGFLAVQLGLLGCVLSGVLHGALALWFLLGLVTPGLSASALDLCVLCAGLGVNLWAALEGARHSRRKILLSVLTQPFYWPLHTPAGIRALYGLFRRPHFWAKTEHGLSRMCRVPLHVSAPSHPPPQPAGDTPRERDARPDPVAVRLERVREPALAG